MKSFEELKNTLGKGNIIIDGSMGALLADMGVNETCPDIVNLMAPDVIKKVHSMYRSAGADMIITDTFGTNPIKLAKYGLRDKLEEICQAAIKNARSEAGDGLVAFDIGPTGEMIAPIGKLSSADAIDNFRVSARNAQDADLVIIETMTDIAEARTAMLACCAENANFAASFSFETNGRTMTGGDPHCAAIIAEALGAAAVGMNCSCGPEHMLAPVKAMLDVTSLPVIVQPNAGLPEMRGGKTVYPLDPDGFAEKMRPIYVAGVSAIGGCCGTTSEHIACLKALTQSVCVNKPAHEKTTYICSARRYAAASETVGAVEVFTDADDLYDIEDDTLAAMIDLRGMTAEEAIEIVRDAAMATSVPLGFIADDAQTLENALMEYCGVALVKCPEEMKTLCEKYGAVRWEDIE